MKRRKLLHLTGVGATIGIAGCSSGSGSSNSGGTTTGGPGGLGRIQYAGPTEPAAGSSFVPKLKVENNGGETQTAEGAVWIAEDNVDYEEEFSFNVESGTTGEYELPELTLPFVDEYTLHINSEEREATLTATADTVSTGEPIPVSDSLRVTVENVEYRDTIYTAADRESEEINGAFNAPSTKILVAFDLHVENISTEETRFPSERLGVDQGDIYVDQPLAAPRGPFLGPNLARETVIGPSEAVRGYVLGQIPRSVAQSETKFTMEGPEEYYRQTGRENSPEFIWTNPAGEDDRSFADFSLKTVQAPDVADVDDTYDITCVVQNEGDAAGELRTVLQQKPIEADSGYTKSAYANSPRRAERVQPDDEAFITFRMSPDETGTYAHQLRPFSREWETTIQ